tara:strand:- start:880 stop:1434 length:555 start_codon:yes stop_codon:yes gene_type:complete
MRYFFILFLILYPFNLYANIKDDLKLKLKETNNVYFKFTQKINKKMEEGECKISYPKKIFCKYNDLYEKIIVSNGNSLIINSKKIRNYLNYKIKDTPLNLILDKNFLLKKLDEIEKVEENNETFYFDITQEKNKITIYFDKNNHDIIGWTTLDIYQNKVETKLFDVQTNLMIDEKIFIVQKYLN